VLGDTAAAEDAVQETYLRAFTKLDTYEPAGKFGAWLTRIAMNEALMARRRRRDDTVSLEDAGAAALAVVDSPEQPTPDQFVEAAHARELLERALDAVPEHFRMVFVLRVVEGLDVRETAESLELNQTTVRTRLFRAQRHLRAEITRQLREQSSEIFDFGDDRCDRLVERVLARLPT
jgi:RNA polymerase sigma-70 factor (ECF subfamily)